MRIRPIGFGGDGVKAVFSNEAFCDLSAMSIELMRPVRCLPDQNEMNISDMA
jgi:hypothetical protein